MPIRIKRNLYVFGPNFLVACPQCSNRADLTNYTAAAKPNITLTCSNCDLMQQWQQPYNEINLMSGWRWVGDDSQPKFGVSAPAGYGGADVCLWIETSSDTTQKSEGVSLRLWLQLSCDGGNLWFLNGEHLVFVQSYAQSPHRSLNHEKSLWLEDWIRQVENKETILSCIKELCLTKDRSSSP